MKWDLKFCRGHVLLIAASSLCAGSALCFKRPRWDFFLFWAQVVCDDTQAKLLVH